MKSSGIDDLIIRTATKEDIPSLLVFEQGVIETEVPFDPTLKRGPNHYYEIEEMITDPQINLVVAEHQGEVVASGYARIENSKQYLQHTQHAYLGFMYTKPDYRGRGLNAMIMEQLREFARSRGITELRLDVYFQNQSAITAYEKIGFVKHMIHMRMPV